MTDAKPLTAEELDDYRAALFDVMEKGHLGSDSDDARLIATIDTLRAQVATLTADRDLWKSRAEAISKDAADQAIQASRMIAGLTAERDAAFAGAVRVK